MASSGSGNTSIVHKSRETILEYLSNQGYNIRLIIYTNSIIIPSNRDSTWTNYFANVIWSKSNC